MDALAVLSRLGRGHFIDEVHAAMLDVAEEVVATGKSGKVTIVLDLVHPDDADPVVVVVREQIKRAMPNTKPKGAMFYAHEGLLHERDPRQPALPEFRVVDEGKGTEFRTPEDAGQEIRKVD